MNINIVKSKDTDKREGGHHQETQDTRHVSIFVFPDFQIQQANSMFLIWSMSTCSIILASLPWSWLARLWRTNCLTWRLSKRILWPPPLWRDHQSLRGVGQEQCRRHACRSISNSSNCLFVASVYGGTKNLEQSQFHWGWATQFYVFMRNRISLMVSIVLGHQIVPDISCFCGKGGFPCCINLLVQDCPSPCASGSVALHFSWAHLWSSGQDFWRQVCKTIAPGRL